MGSSVIPEFAVNLIGKDNKIMFDAKRRDFFKFLKCLSRAGWVARKIHHENLGARCDVFLQFLGGHSEIVFSPSSDSDGNAMSQDDARAV